MWKQVDYLVVGSGFFGAVVAERLASQMGRRVLVIDRREHVGGNCYSECDPESGIEFHRYGTHVFHTANAEVYNYLRRFTHLNDYRHQVLANYGNRLYPIPVNLETINMFFGKNFSPTEAQSFIQHQRARESCENPGNLEEKAISLVGRELYEAFIKGYTRKQWGRDPKELPPGIITRLPIRFDHSRDYYRHWRWQGIPEDGYAKLFARLLRHRHIRVETGIDFREIRPHLHVRRKIIFTGPIDSYFGSVLGALDWRSVRFEKDVHEIDTYQGTAIVNFAEESVPYTRIHEPKHLHPERNDTRVRGRTIVIREYPHFDMQEKHYPVRSAENLRLLRRYQVLARAQETKVVFGGRLASYAYLDMDMTISSALKCARAIAMGELKLGTLPIL